ncbi:unnamed protein product [Miscanthus lutarioriparius]|uniref:Uncharacterized protein n=1 Tax=Miscanthus lutarioriparius TaxID=422564 RepID=A0A811S537_9POAL|nr:unnamed protein product [Miscanthus lutarioriparius]
MAQMDGYNYSDSDRTRDFLSQLDPYSSTGSYDIFSDAAYPFPSSSTVSAPQMGMATLDLNSQGEGWPGMVGYQGLLCYGAQDGGIGSSMCPLPFTFVAVVVPSAYTRLAVAVEEVPWSVTLCRHPPVVAVALPCLL